MTADELTEKLIALRNETKKALEDHKAKTAKALALAEELQGLGFVPKVPYHSETTVEQVRDIARRKQEQIMSDAHKSVYKLFNEFVR